MIDKCPNNSKTKMIPLSNSLTVLKRATKLSIAGELILKLNYIDLQILIFSIEVDALKQHLKHLQREKDIKNGIVSREEATQDDINNL